MIVNMLKISDVKIYQHKKVDNFLNLFFHFPFFCLLKIILS